jgi:two-component system response regulator GlrR
VSSFERRYLEELLRLHENRVSAAARAAGVDRIYFYRLLWKHGLRTREQAGEPTP